MEDPERLKHAYNQAWDARKFEIELYWKRATYFWAFNATTFVGYFALIRSEAYLAADRFNHAEVYFVVCIGLVLSVAWFLTNMGSKTWQRHWESHVDLLEDSVTGPLYKTVFTTKTFSVTKINELVSLVFVGTWILLGVKFLLDQDLLHLNPSRANWLVILSTVFAACAVYAMIFGRGRGRFTNREVKMYRRSFNYSDPKNQQAEQGVAPKFATRSEMDLEGSDKPQPESEARSR
jgi:uncharacterized membrane protein (DUF485 family)